MSTKSWELHLNDFDRAIYAFLTRGNSSKPRCTKRQAVPEAADDPEIVEIPNRPFLWRTGEWNSNVRRCVNQSGRKLKTRRHDADDRQRADIDVHRLVDNLWIRVDPLLPEALAEEDRSVRNARLVFRREAAAKHGLYAQNVKETRRHQFTGDAFWLIGAGKRERGMNERSEMAEDSIVILPVAECGGRHEFDSVSLFLVRIPRVRRAATARTTLNISVLRQCRNLASRRRPRGIPASAQSCAPRTTHPAPGSS